VVDNILTGTPFLLAMSRLGGMKTVDGGSSVVMPVRMSKNTTAMSFKDYDLLDTTPQNQETSAQYEPTGLAATATLSWMEDVKNMGRGKLIDMWNQKIDDAADTLKDKLNLSLIGNQPSAGSDDPNSLSEVIDEGPTAAAARGTTPTGGIAQATYSWWRNQNTSGGAFTVADMNTMFNDCSDGVDFPTFLFTYQTPFEYYENSQVGQIRYQDTRIADAGFPSLQYKNAPVLWDSQVGSNHQDEIYFINTKYTKLCVWAKGDFIMSTAVEPANQAARTAKMLWMGNLVCDNRRRNGTLHGISAPA
jgi:hypothetical protein